MTAVDSDEGSATGATSDTRSRSHGRDRAVIMAVSLAGLLLEIGYTRVVSFKLWYYYTYLVIGLALLGIGSGGVFVAVWPRLKRASTDRLIAVCAISGALSIAAGYLIVAKLNINTVKIWNYGTSASYGNLVRLSVICFVLFATFIAIGVIVATLLGRAREEVGRLYFADLVGAGLACLLAVPLITRLGPPSVILLSALILALVGLASLPRRVGVAGGLAAVLVLGLAVPVIDPDVLPDVKPEATKAGDRGTSFSEWGPVFRVDVVEVREDAAMLLHDGSFGSRIDRFDGDVATLTRYETDPRAIPFRVLGRAPGRELIIGSAGGNEILASLFFGSDRIEAVELNPVTVSLLTDHYADYTGHLPERPEVDLHRGDGRSYLSRRDTSYDLIWYVAPDSYAANNAASSGAFVLSESYLYTTEMVVESLEHLSDDGIVVVQFGELNFDTRPNRTARYVTTARAAFERLGIADPGAHMLVGAFIPDRPGEGDLSTIVLKRTPFTDAEAEAFVTGSAELPDMQPIYAPGRELSDSIVARLAAASDSEAASIEAAYPRDISAITDDGPFFWHFAPFGDVLSKITQRIHVIDPEQSIGERVLLLLLGLSIVYAAAFLLLPFFAARRAWSALPAKGLSAVYFAALGLGFMFFEITMIQRLVLFLGYPTYSLTVTLASILVFAGLGSLLSKRWADRRQRVMPRLLALLAVLTVLYQVLLDDLTNGLLSQGLAVRVLVAVLVLAPLGICLGMFMPLGLGLVARLSGDDDGGEQGEAYVAWSWAVNGFFSVIGSVLTTILSMTFGFRAVQYLALAVYAVAAVAFTRLHGTVDRTTHAAAS